MKIYCAGPLFNGKEREEMLEIAQHLESSGYDVFLPHRDGLELSQVAMGLIDEGMQQESANELLAKVIFHVDTFQVSDCDGLVLNMNGRVPDEGAMVEAGIAWSLGKPVVIYKNDARSVIMGIDNPLVLGLSGFNAVSDTAKIAKEFDRLLCPTNKKQEIEWSTFRRGKKLHRIFTKHRVNRLRAEQINKILG